MPDSSDTPVSAETPDVETDPQNSGEVVEGTIPVTENSYLTENSEQKPKEPSFPWWIVAVIAVVAAGGAVFLILEFRKTKKSQ